MSTTIVLAMHGMPPSDFPRREAGEFFGLHARLEHSDGPDRAAVEARYAVLDALMRGWPRTEQNDPYQAGSEALARGLAEASCCPVLIGYNEFCAPSLDEALDRALASADRVVVVTPMMTRGGEHSERDIPAAIARARSRHPGADIAYLWPLSVDEIARFLAAQVAPLL